MTAPENPYASPQADADHAADSPSAIWSRENAGQLRLVYIGLSLVYWGIIVMILGAFAMIGGTTVFAGAPLGMAGLAGLAVIGIGGLLAFIGPFFCLSVPADSDARRYIVISVVLQGANVLLAFTAPFVDVPEVWANFVVSAAGLLASVFFVLFLMRLAVYLAQPQITKSGRTVLIAAGILFLVLLSTAIPPIAVLITGVLGALFGLAVLVFGLVVFVMYVNLINAVRKVVKLRMTLATG